MSERYVEPDESSGLPKYNPYKKFRHYGLYDSSQNAGKTSSTAAAIFDTAPGVIAHANIDCRIPFNMEGFLSRGDGLMASYWKPEENQINLAEDPSYPY